MKTKYTLILCAILLATAAISGCTDADAPDTTFDEQTIQKLLDDDTPIKDVHDMINAVADSKNYDVDVVRNENTGEIVSIGVDDNKGNHARFINTDKNDDVDKVTLNGKEIYPNHAEATSPQTQLGNEPSTTKSAIHTAGGYTLDDLFNMAKNNPDELLGMDIEDTRLTGLGPTTDGKMPDGTDTRYIPMWRNPAPGIDRYIEEYDYEGKLNTIRIRQDENNFLSVLDKSNDDDILDGKISAILLKIDGGEATKIIS